MPRLGALLIVMVLGFSPFQAARAWAEGDDYSVRVAHPRLLLSPRRVRLLGREAERKTMRWAQFAALMDGGARMPEAGFAHALYFVATGDQAHGRAAIEWALAGGDDTRQVALVFDWCQELLGEAERARLVKKLTTGLEELRGRDDMASVRTRVFAAAALAEHVEGLPERELGTVIQGWWRDGVAERLRNGEVIALDEIYPLVELLHVIDRNLRIDLRTDVPAYFTSLPTYMLLSYCPAVYPASENDFHIPAMRTAGEPDLRIAALSRAADLALIAFDPNAVETQFLQGWSMQDSFLMRGTFGITYEFLWANPYQPGLSFYSAPLSLHDPRSGRLAVRSGWDGDAGWFHSEPGLMQTFRESGIEQLDWTSFTQPMDLGAAVIVPLHGQSRFTIAAIDPVTYYLVGLEPGTTYDVEVDDEGLYEDTADPGGILVLEAPAGQEAGVRLSKAPVQNTDTR